MQIMAAAAAKLDRVASPETRLALEAASRAVKEGMVLGENEAERGQWTKKP